MVSNISPALSAGKFNADDFNVQNPDGRYVLDLSNPVEFSVAAQLMVRRCRSTLSKSELNPPVISALAASV